MGVRYLNQYLLSHSKGIHQIFLRSLYKKWVVIDTSIYLYKFKSQDVLLENMEKFIRNPNIKTATKFYFDYLYQENFARYIFNSIIVNMQQICQEKNIKLVNIPCFEHDFIKKIYGLWLSSANGLIECCRIDYNSTYGESWNIANDPRRNHFSPNGHKILADNIIPHIKTYITTDQEFHISLLYPELFA
jgi:hypothetical protein